MATRILSTLIILLTLIAGSFHLTRDIRGASAEVPRPLFDRAVDFVRSEAISLSGAADSSDPSFRFFSGLSAMSYIQTNVSTARNNLSRRTDSVFAPAAGTEMCLLEQRGSCGNHIAAFIDIMLALGVPVREVQIYYEMAGERFSHIVAEVEWAGEWHMFDVSWGFLPHEGDPLQALSFAEASAAGHVEGWHNEINAWRASREGVSGQQIFAYLDAGGDVVTDGNGTIHPYVVNISDHQAVYGFAHIPNYIGRNRRQNGRVGEIVYEVDLPPGLDVLTLVPAGHACADGGLVIGAQEQEIGADPMVFTGVSGRTEIRVRSENDICYVVLEEMFATAGPPPA